MFKKIFFGSLFLSPIFSFAQDGTSSPYSYYGIGDIKFKGTIENRTMGGITFFADSIHANFQNPATIARLKMSTLSLGGSQVFTTMKNESEKEKANRTSFDYLTLNIPIGKKWGTYLGLAPFSSVGYKILSTDKTTGDMKRVTGSGGLNRVFVGAGYEINKNLNIGLEVAYNFGTIERNYSVFPSSILPVGTRLQTSSRITGWGFNAGAIYYTKIHDFDLTFATSFSPSSTFYSENTRNMTTAVLATAENDANSTSNYVDIPVENSTIKLPSKFSFGTGIGKDKKWFLGIESTYLSTGDYGNTNLNTNARYESAQRFAIGGFYIPKYNSFKNYLERINYRGGFRYENTGLIINNETITDKAVTVGLGLPVPGMLSNINLGVEFGTKGTTKSNLIQENYIMLSVGLSFNDKWFVKRKYD